MARELTRSEYARTLDIILSLKAELSQLADEKGILHPEVLELSATIDRYIVKIQQHWHRQKTYQVG